ncbi:pyridoxamine 5'-phosphate oxidase family protein [Mycobacterium sp. CVI_P3]|uniref:Pyridoxamine 5'-phosphate oxidase family protein n=1 Tax=Mycobacterium pinniadriaticum TaxID=2994102 RepID=A0ABT3SNU6_9MYCO|nr:pyridoxamine 5'-phosphate oxidase family protein [Mycobacterium pinniadriaticum]MCX2934792.1 pyridoxamine 5'-phosphate oxidase family protein [Mycobacterium pinniadriaticum]MCX2941209.1 pyridoxamine 5'-phosphate oxidase family protein [Mycobacterium pinniadriaticum]
MSVRVDLDRLAGTLDDFTFAYLVTVGADHHAHTVAVDPTLSEGVIDVGPVGGHTRANVALHDTVTLIWPPGQRGGYTLIVDGRARLGETDATFQVVPGRAVLHRRATPDSPPSATGCVDDCVPLDNR